MVVRNSYMAPNIFSALISDDDTSDDDAEVVSPDIVNVDPHSPPVLPYYASDEDSEDNRYVSTFESDEVRAKKDAKTVESCRRHDARFGTENTQTLLRMIEKSNAEHAVAKQREAALFSQKLADRRAAGNMRRNEFREWSDLQNEKELKRITRQGGGIEKGLATTPSLMLIAFTVLVTSLPR